MVLDKVILVEKNPNWQSFVLCTPTIWVSKESLTQKYRYPCAGETEGAVETGEAHNLGEKWPNLIANEKSEWKKYWVSYSAQLRHCRLDDSIHPSGRGMAFQGKGQQLWLRVVTTKSRFHFFVISVLSNQLCLRFSGKLKRKERQWGF